MSNVNTLSNWACLRRLDTERLQTGKISKCYWEENRVYFSRSLCPSDIPLHCPFTQRFSAQFMAYFLMQWIFIPKLKFTRRTLTCTTLRHDNSKNPSQTIKLMRSVY